MKITFIGHDKVYPPISADAQRFYWVSKYLSEKFKVVFIGHSGMITRFKNYRINENFEIIEIPGRTAMMLGALGYFLTKKPLFDLILAFGCKTFPKMLRVYLNHANESSILAFEGCWYFPLLKYVADKKTKLIIYDARNVEYVLKEQAYTGIYKKLLPKLFNLERGLCQESDLILATCASEKERFAELYSLDKSKIKVTPPGMILPKEGRRVEKKTILFIGGAYFANFEAAQFINNVLAKRLPEFKFRIAGRCSMAIKKSAPNVKIYGLIPEKEKEELLRTSEIAINPILHGAGVNVKLLEYMAYGIPTVTTELGARGIEYTSESPSANPRILRTHVSGSQEIEFPALSSSFFEKTGECEESQNPKQLTRFAHEYEDEHKPFLISELDNFAESIKLLQANQGLAERLGANSRKLITEKYEWSKVTQGIAEIIICRYNEKTK